MLPVVAIVGKPNTGKSTLFNRIIGKKKSITFDEAGTTRDRVFESMELNGKKFLLVDTGGLDFSSSEDSIDNDIKKQSLVAIEEANAIMFVIDSTRPLSVDDMEVANILRKSRKPIMLVATKIDNTLSLDYMPSIYELGLGEFVKVSAIHKKGLDELWVGLDDLIKDFSPSNQSVDESRTAICFLGRPNVGKSSLMNCLFGEDKVIVSDVSGTTRDSVYMPFEFEDHKYLLIDTAGIRKSGKLRFSEIEKYSVIRSLQSLEESDVAVLTMDCTDPLAKQDLRVVQYILEAKKGLVIVLNKADLLKPEEKNELIYHVHKRMPFAHFAPVIFTSAKSGKNTEKILELAKKIHEERGKKVNTREFNYFIENVFQEHIAGVGVKFKFAEQVDVHPPTFLIFAKGRDDIHFSYERYIENKIREQYGFEGTALDIKLKDSSKKKTE